MKLWQLWTSFGLSDDVDIDDILDDPNTDRLIRGNEAVRDIFRDSNIQEMETFAKERTPPLAPKTLTGVTQNVANLGHLTDEERTAYEGAAKQTEYQPVGERVRTQAVRRTPALTPAQGAAVRAAVASSKSEGEALASMELRKPGDAPPVRELSPEELDVCLSLASGVREFPDGLRQTIKDVRETRGLFLSEGVLALVTSDRTASGRGLLPQSTVVGRTEALRAKWITPLNVNLQVRHQDGVDDSRDIVEEAAKGIQEECERTNVDPWTDEILNTAVRLNVLARPWRQRLCRRRLDAFVEAPVDCEEALAIIHKHETHCLRNPFGPHCEAEVCDFIRDVGGSVTTCERIQRLRDEARELSMPGRIDICKIGIRDMEEWEQYMCSEMFIPGLFYSSTANDLEAFIGAAEAGMAPQQLKPFCMKLRDATLQRLRTFQAVLSRIGEAAQNTFSFSNEFRNTSRVYAKDVGEIFDSSEEAMQLLLMAVNMPLSDALVSDYLAMGLGLHKDVIATSVAPLTDWVKREIHERDANGFYSIPDERQVSPPTCDAAPLTPLTLDELRALGDRLVLVAAALKDLKNPLEALRVALGKPTDNFGPTVFGQFNPKTGTTLESSVSLIASGELSPPYEAVSAQGLRTLAWDLRELIDLQRNFTSKVVGVILRWSTFTDHLNLNYGLNGIYANEMSSILNTQIEAIELGEQRPNRAPKEASEGVMTYLHSMLAGGAKRGDIKSLTAENKELQASILAGGEL